jgi:hypothetical protein
MDFYSIESKVTGDSKKVMPTRANFGEKTLQKVVFIAFQGPQGQKLKQYIFSRQRQG